ncbi:CRADD protein, partial [Probosciger aterrimus]|nr:CRADD protein [Probosciger aterrimus]
MSGCERAMLLAVQEELSEEELQRFKFLLGGHIPAGMLAPATRPELCSILLQRFPGRALRITAGLLRRMGRHDLLLRFQLPQDEDDTVGMEEEPMGAPAASRCHPIAPPPPRRLTERDLMQIAQRFGKEWQEVGILCLGLEKSRLEQIREDHPHSLVLQSFEMLREWSRRHKAEATAPQLRASLRCASVDPDVFDLLQ